MKPTVVEMKGIKKSYRGVTVLDSVDFELKAGEVHIIAGDKGAGKTTFLKIFSGSEKKDSGQIKVFGKNVEITSPYKAENLGISVIYNECDLIEDLSIAENIFLGKEPLYKGTCFIDHRILKTRARVILEMLGFKYDINTRVKDLDVVERQIIKVGKSLSFDARIIGVDEPSSVLSGAELDRLIKLIKVLKLKGISIIYTSQNSEEFYRVGDRISILRDGIFTKTRYVKRVRKRELIKQMTGREIGRIFPKTGIKIKERALSLENVSSRGGIKNVSFDVYSGEVLGIFCMSDSERAGLGRVIFGAEKLDSGSISIRGEKVDIHSPFDAIGMGIGLLTADRNRSGMIYGMNVLGNITITNLKTRFGVIKKKKEKESVFRLIKELNIGLFSLEDEIFDLEGGVRQKVSLARALFSESKIVIFDEPTQGVSIRHKEEIYNIINSLIKREIAVIFMSSSLYEILGISDRIAVMYKGTIADILQNKSTSAKKILKLAGIVK